MGEFQLLIALNDFDHYYAKMYQPSEDRRELINKLAKTSDLSRFLVLEAIPEFGEYTVWEADAWYEQFKDRENENDG